MLLFLKGNYSPPFREGQGGGSLILAVVIQHLKDIVL